MGGFIAGWAVLLPVEDAFVAGTDWYGYFQLTASCQRI
jgi:hypothetical protein